MRPKLVLCAIAALLLACAPAQAAGASGPATASAAKAKRSQPRKQRTQAASSPAPTAGLVERGDLWATVNICDPPAKLGAIGIRASIPVHGRGNDQWMRIRAQWFDDGDRAWRTVKVGGNSDWFRVGSGREEMESGYTFTFTPPAIGRRLVLRGMVDLQWRDGSRVVADERVLTETGHADPVDELLADSRVSCQIIR